jgi:hypothetical protein
MTGRQAPGREGVRRDSFKVPEGYWSEITMSILAPAWEASYMGVENFLSQAAP